MEGRDDAGGVAGAIRHAPLGVEGVVGDGALAIEERGLTLGGREHQRRRERRRAREQCQRHEGGRPGPAHPHGALPTTTRLKVSGSKYFAATRWTSATVTLPTRSL